MFLLNYFPLTIILLISYGISKVFLDISEGIFFIREQGSIIGFVTLPFIAECLLLLYGKLKFSPKDKQVSEEVLFWSHTFKFWFSTLIVFLAIIFLFSIQAIESLIFQNISFGLVDHSLPFFYVF